MASYKIAVYDKSDVIVKFTGDGNYTLTIADGAVPSVIKVKDKDAGKAGKEFNDGNPDKDGGSGSATPENQSFSGKIGGVKYENTTTKYS